MDIKSPVGEARNDYLYTATGTKLRVTQRYNSNFNASPVVGSDINTSSLDKTKTTDYVGNKIYEGNSLKKILVDGGYIENNQYHFYAKDHLGNNRAVMTSTGTANQRNHYYPFGVSFADGVNKDKDAYKYNGKEQDRMHGLDHYDYSARYYYSAIGRFTTVDPLAEKYYSISPYVYVANNPLKFIDPTGMSYTDYRNEKGELLYETDDGLVDIIILVDQQISKLEKALQTAKDNGTINDAETNKQEMHVLGINLNDWTEKSGKGYYPAGDGESNLLYKTGYNVSYDQDNDVGTMKAIGSDILNALSGFESQKGGHYTMGRIEGRSDKQNAILHKFNPRLKNNEATIKLK